MAFKHKDLMVNLLPQVPPGDAGGGFGGGGGDGGGQGGAGCTCLTLPATMCVCLTYPATIQPPCWLTLGCFAPTYHPDMCYFGTTIPRCGPELPTMRPDCNLAGSVPSCSQDGTSPDALGTNRPPWTVYGADPEQLAALKDQLQKQIDLVEKAQKAQAERKKK